MLEEGGDLGGGLAHFVLQRAVGAAGEQRTRRRLTIVERGKVERCIAILVRRVDVAAAIDGGSYLTRPVVELLQLVKHRVSIFVAELDVVVAR